ncbi:MAG: hypothetical protein ACKVRN_16380 [Pyrinomonadaceae bacterium]
MKGINLFSRLIITITITLFFCAFVSAQTTSDDSKAKQEAERTWDALVKIKGGREKLHSISSVLFTLYLKNNKSLGPAWQVLHVLPDKAWQTGYHVDGTLITSRCIGSTEEWANPNGTGDSYNEGHPEDGFALKRIIYLLETKYDKPVPIAVVRRKVGKVTYDVLQASFRDWRLDFFFEPEAMLITQVIRYTKGMKPGETYTFYDYAEIDGIKMPQRESLTFLGEKSDKTWPIGINFNVDYDPNLFKGPLKSAPLDGWKRKSQ